MLKWLYRSVKWSQMVVDIIKQKAYIKRKFSLWNRNELDTYDIYTLYTELHT